MAEGISTEVEDGPQGPQLVKRATAPPGTELLWHEAARLEEARHPGVVDLVEHRPDRLVLRWVGSATLDVADLSVVQAAAVLAAVASTVADLHAMGLVHGRLDPSHVVLGPDLRPRLCGMRGGDPRHPPPGPADDVAALGRLIDATVGLEADQEPIPERRWRRRRWAGYQRRALQALADHAQHDDPRQRPSARALAAAISEAVPQARFPLPSNHPTPAEPDTPPDAEPHGEDGEDGEDGEARYFLGMRLHQGPMPSGAPRRPAPPTEPTPPARPADRAQDDPGRSVRTRLVAAAAVTTLATLGWVLRPSGVSPGTSVVGRAAPPAPSATTPPVPVVTDAEPAEPAVHRPAPAPSCPEVEEPAIDVDGDGCVESYRIDGTAVALDGVRYRVGQDGDRISVGDWDCDGRATPGAVRPSTGEVFLFESWTAPGQATTVPALGRHPGAARLEPPTGRPEDCPHPRLALADGSTIGLEDLEGNR